MWYGREGKQLYHSLIDSPTWWKFSIPFFLILFIHLFFTFQMTMKRSKLALLLLLLVALEILLFNGSDAKPWLFWRRRRRRCTSGRPSPTWINDWGQDFNFNCPNSKKSFYQFCYLIYIACFFCAYFHLVVRHAHRMNN